MLTPLWEYHYHKSRTDIVDIRRKWGPFKIIKKIKKKIKKIYHFV